MMRPGMSKEIDMTEDIQVLELELELLKRKRMMVQQQQQMLASQRQHGYERPQMFNQSYGSHKEHDFINLYDNPSSSGSNNSKKFGHKRQASDEPWRSPPSKRFNASRNQPKRGYQQHSNKPYTWNSNTPNTQPLMNINVSRPQSLPQKKSGYISGKSSSRYPSKSNKCPQPDRNQATVTNISKNMILRGDGEPNTQITGRLELALGFILKKIKIAYMHLKKYEEIFKGDKLLRVLKQRIRERLRCAMLDKHVGAIDLTYTHYRSMYPSETDKEMLDDVLAARPVSAPEKQPSLAIRLSLKVPPGMFIKHHLDKLVDVKLDEMFTKLQKLYDDENEKESTDKIIQENLELIRSTPTKDLDDFTTDDIPSNGKSFEVTEETEQETNFKQAAAAANIEETDVKMIDEATVKAWEKYNSKFFRPVFYEKIMNRHIPRSLYHLLPNYKQRIMKILETDNSYQITKEEIYRVGNELNHGIGMETATKTEKSTDGAFKNHKEYCVKILGLPHLPNRAVMKSFLDNFEPSSTKKHKKQSNLLFVKLPNKDNYESLLKADGELFGDITLKITSTGKGSERTELLKVVEDRVGNRTHIDEIIPLNSELDEQITDLLCSIRKAEEAEQKPYTEKNVNNDDSIIECVVQHEIVDLVSDDIDTSVDESNLVIDLNPQEKNEVQDDVATTQENTADIIVKNVSIEGRNDEPLIGDVNKDNEGEDNQDLNESANNENITIPENKSAGENDNVSK